MRRLLGIAMTGALAFGLAAPAYADHGYERERCGGGGCDNEREESYENTGCKYVCPSFERSPVHDAFNFSPFICMPGATCYEDGDRRQDGSGGGQPR